MSANWIYKKENSIFTIVQTRAKKVYGTKYPSMRYTMDNEPDGTTTAFPTVYVKYLPMAEIGKTLDGADINAIMLTVQVEVVTSKTQGQNTCREIAWQMVEEFKKLLFEMALSPEILNTGNDTHKMVFRMRRVLGADDTIK